MTSTSTNNPEQPNPPHLNLQSGATEVIVTDVKPETVERYRDWAERIDRAERAFPGFLGSQTQAPPPGETIWTTLLHFATVEQLEAWLHSRERRALLDEAELFIHRVISHRVDASFPGWVGNDPTTGESPSRWRTGALVLLTLFPVVMLEERFLLPRLASLNPSLSTFLGNVISVAVTTWPLMPIAVWAFSPWLFPKSRSRRLVTASFALLILCYAAEVAVFWRLIPSAH